MLSKGVQKSFSKRGVVTRDYVHCLFRDLPIRPPNERTTATRYSYDAMVSIHKYMAVRTFIHIEHPMPKRKVTNRTMGHPPVIVFSDSEDEN